MQMAVEETSHELLAI